MKASLVTYSMMFFLTVVSTTAGMAGRTLDGTKIVSDEEVELLPGGGYTSTSKFIRQTLALDREELAEVNTLNLQGASPGTAGLRKIGDELLPHLPNLKVFILSHNELRSDEDLEILSSFLSRFENLRYIDIEWNGIADKVVPFVQAHVGQTDLTEKFQNKVVFSCKTLLDEKLPPSVRETYKNWYPTHTNYYQLELVH